MNKEEQNENNNIKNWINDINEILKNCSLSNIQINEDDYNEFKISYMFFKTNFNYFITKVAFGPHKFSEDGKDLIKGNYIFKQMIIFFYSINFKKEKKKYSKKDIIFDYVIKMLIKLYKNDFIDEKELCSILRFNLFLFFKYTIHGHIFDGVFNTCLDSGNIMGTEKSEQLMNIIIDDTINAIQNHFIIIYVLQEHQSLFLKLIYYKTQNKDLNEKIEKLFILIFKFSYNKSFSLFLLNQIKESLYFIKKDTLNILTQKLLDVEKSTDYLLKIINFELKEQKDEFCPTYNFVFDNTKYNGITYKSTKETLKKNFALFFSFNASDKQEKDKEYTLINFKLENKDNSVIKIVLKNSKLKFSFGNNSYVSSSEIQYNKTYLVQLECQKPFLGASKLSLKINDFVTENFSMDIEKSYNCSVYIGWDGMKSNFIGKMGSVIMIGKNFDDTFSKHLSHLKGNYELILQINKETDIKDYTLYKNNDIFSMISYIEARNFFTEKFDMIKENFLFSISPQSIFNSYRKKRQYFQNIFAINSPHTEVSNYFNLKDPPKASYGTPFSIEIEFTSGNFIKNNGLYIITSYFELYYNILRNGFVSDLSEILINNITENLKLFLLILENVKYECFIEQIETFSFSLYKIILLLTDYQFLPKKITEQLILILEFCFKRKEKRISEDFDNYCNKFFCFILDNRFFEYNDFSLIEKCFSTCEKFIEKDDSLLNLSVFNKIMSFKFILEPNELNKFYHIENLEKTNKEYKDIKHSYKRLLNKFISRCHDASIYYLIFEKIFLTEINSSLELRYKILKLFYKFYNSEQTLTNLSVSKIDSDNRNSNLSDSKNKNKLNYDLQLYILFKKILLTEIEKEINEIKEEKKEKNIYSEKMKSILILIMYEECDKNFIKKLNNNNNESPYMLFLPKDFFNNEINQTMMSRQSSTFHELSNVNSSDLYDFEKEESSKSKNKTEKIPDIIPIDLFCFDNISFILIKTFFVCLCSNWPKENKISFIKSNNLNFDNIDFNFAFNSTKKYLLCQFIEIMKNFAKENVLIDSITLFFNFLNQIIYQFIHNENNNKRINCLFSHLFESKLLLNNFFNFILIQEFDEKTLQYIDTSITEIINNILYFHPRPFIFSFVKKTFNNKNTKLIGILLKIIEYFIYITKNNHIDDSKNSKNSKIKNYIYYNEFQFLRVFEKLTELNESLFIEYIFFDNLKLFYSIKNLLVEISKNKMIFDPYLYIMSSNFVEETKHKKQKFINIQTIFLNIINLTIYLSNILFTKENENLNENSNEISTEVKKDNISKPEKISIQFLKDIIDNLIIETHTVGFYMDRKNPNIKFNNKIKISDSIKNRIQIYKDKRDFEAIKDNRLITLMAFNNIYKFQVILDKIIEKEKKEDEDLSEERMEYKNYLNGKFQEQVKSDLLILKNSIKKLDKENTKISFIEDKKEINLYIKTLDYILSKENFVTTEMNEKIKSIYKKEYKVELEEREMSLSYNNIKDLQKTLLKKRKNSFSDCENKCYLNGQIKINQENKKIINKVNKEYDLGDFCEIDPILCLKRDLLLNKLGYYFIYDFFYNAQFLNMKYQFFYKYDIYDKKSGFNNQANIMTLTFPSWLKNYMNSENYYPKMFLRPDPKFFQRETFRIGHQYFKYDEQLIINKEIHCENTHGLMNTSNYNLFKRNSDNKDLNYDSIFECENISNVHTLFGHLITNKNYLLFQSDLTENITEKYEKKEYLFSSLSDDLEKKEKQIIMRLIDIQEMIIRRFIFIPQAIEIFLKNGKSYFFNFFSEEKLNSFLTKIAEKQNNSKKINFQIISIEKNKKYIEDYKLNILSQNWEYGKISTLDYLLLLNKYSGRSYNDIAQYVILPWTTLDIDKNTYRDFSLPMGAQTDELKEKAIEKYNNGEEGEKCHFQLFYSSSSFVNLYLVRMEPYTILQIKLQKNCFDDPNRQFHSFKEISEVFNQSSENRELIPEYYLMGECFLNLNYNEFGIRSKDKVLINNIDTDSESGKNCLFFIIKHKQFLNSIQVKKNINYWIDLVFGVNQTKVSPNEILNKFPYFCYDTIKDKLIELRDKIIENSDVSETIKLNKEYFEEARSLISTILGFGQVPFQLYKEIQAPYKEIEGNSDSNQSNITKIAMFYNSNESKMEQLFKEKILYMNFTTSGENVYVLTYNQIKVVSYLLKEINSINISENKPAIIYNLNFNEEDKTSKEVNSMSLYKYLIFDIEDGAFFFIGGYYDKTIKIYSNYNKLTKVILTENYVSAIRKILNQNIFFSGHENGKIIKWEININKSKEITLEIKKINSFTAHHDLVNAIEINLKYNVILSSSVNGELIIRKLYDYEILSVINNPKIIFSDIQIANDLIYSLNYIKKYSTFILYGYTLNGITFNSTKKDIFLPPHISEENGEVILISGISIFQYNLTLGKRMSYHYNLNVSDYSNFNDNRNSKANAQNQNNNLMRQTFSPNNFTGKNERILHYCYNESWRIIFCAFENGVIIKECMNKKEEENKKEKKKEQEKKKLEELNKEV